VVEFDVRVWYPHPAGCLACFRARSNDESWYGVHGCVQRSMPSESTTHAGIEIQREHHCFVHSSSRRAPALYEEYMNTVLYHLSRDTSLAACLRLKNAAFLHCPEMNAMTLGSSASAAPVVVVVAAAAAAATPRNGAPTHEHLGISRGYRALSRSPLPLHRAMREQGNSRKGDRDFSLVYLTTKFAILPGTKISRTTCFPSR
jgi:hypothetical protein